MTQSIRRISRQPSALALVVALLVTLMGSLTFAAQSEAGVPTHGATWRGGKLKLFSKLPKRYDRSITAAVRQYNQSGARVRLRVVKRPGQANVVLKLGNIPVPGLSTQGRPRHGKSLVRISRRWDVAARTDGPYFASFLVTHELGHVLGLDHPDRAPRLCTVMNPGFFGVCRRPAQPPETWVCGLLRPVDKRALVNLYRGRPSKTGPWYCGSKRPTPSLEMKVEDAAVTVVPDDFGVAARIRWKPVKGLRMLIERRDAPCGKIKPGMPIKTVMNSDADNTVSAATGVAVDPFTTESAKTVCYSLTLIKPKTEARSKTVNLEARIQTTDG